MSHMRVSSLQELIYKNGSTGVVKAKVTIVFDNTDKSQGPPGFEDKNEITVSRHICNGKTKYYLD